MCHLVMPCFSSSYIDLQLALSANIPFCRRSSAYIQFPLSLSKKTPRRAKTLRGTVLALSIFPGRCQPSIVDRNELNYRVRNGNGWTLILISTNSMSSGTARKQTILYCLPRLLSRLFQVFHLYPHRETSVSVSRQKRKRSPVLLAL